MPIQLKRIYDTPTDNDGYRVLVDGLWPRGVAKDKAGIDLWLKEAAPTAGLRKWFNHDPALWSAFQVKYAGELAGREGLLDQLLKPLRSGKTVTLLYAARDTEHNNAVALKTYLEARLGSHTGT